MKDVFRFHSFTIAEILTLKLLLKETIEDLWSDQVYHRHLSETNGLPDLGN